MFFACQVTACTLQLIFFGTVSLVLRHHYCADQPFGLWIQCWCLAHAMCWSGQPATGLWDCRVAMACIVMLSTFKLDHGRMVLPRFNVFNISVYPTHLLHDIHALSDTEEKGSLYNLLLLKKKIYVYTAENEPVAHLHRTLPRSTI